MSKIESLKEKARKDKKTIILPEGEEPRTVEAAGLILKQGIADLILIGNKEKVISLAKSKSVDMGKIKIVDPATFEKTEEVINEYYELRKHKGITKDEAKEQIFKDTVTYGAIMTRLDMADGFVAGATHTTPNVARAALHCLKIDRSIRILCSCFLIELKDCPYGENGLFVFADCGILPKPSASQLSGITFASSGLMKCLFDVEPKVALLSYSTRGSAKGDSVDKVAAALKLIKEKNPNLKVDGELQLDAAIVPEVADIKAKDSPVGGRANVLIFPNLDAGNIAYKLIQRLGKARVVGPILLGLTKPASDLSRGCTVEEIVDAVAVTAVRAQGI